MTGEREIEILKEKARTDEGLFRTTFVPTMEKFELIQAETRNGKRILPVAKSAIEIKPLASTGPGFDTTSQVTIAYPEVNIGSKLYIKYKKTTFRPPYPGAFFLTYPVGWHENIQSMTVDFSSDVPLYHELIDPGGNFQVEGGGKKIRFTLKKPLFKMAVEEEFAIYDALSSVWIGVTNLKSWSQFPKKTIAAYEAVLSSKLPDKFEAILQAAKQKATTVEQIDEVTSKLATAVRYVGDWRAVKGTYVPRSLKEVAKTGYGDCKDFSAVTGAILRKMGYEVNSAWIARGPDWISSPLTIASPDMNHAILYVKKDGKEMWIDPTNTASFAQGIFTDIADRPAIVLHPNGAFIGRTPAMKSSDGEWTTNADIQLQSDSVLESKGKLVFDGRGALQFTAAELFNSKAANDYTFINWLAVPANVIDWKVGGYSLSSRIVSRIEPEFEYHERWRPAFSTAGTGYTLPAIGWLNYFRFKRETRASNLNVGYPLRVRRNYKITGKKVVLPKDIKCEGQSPWADFSRHIQMEKGALKIEEFIDFKMKVVPATSIATPEFAKFQDGILQCMQDALIVFR